MLSSTAFVQHRVFIFACWSDNMEEFTDMNIQLRRRNKCKFMFQDYSPVHLWRIILSKLLKCNIYFLFGVDLLPECFCGIPKNVRPVLNASLCSTLINEGRTKQELRLSFGVLYSDTIKDTKEDFQLDIKLLINNVGLKIKYVDISTLSSPRGLFIYPRT